MMHYSKIILTTFCLVLLSHVAIAEEAPDEEKEPKSKVPVPEILDVYERNAELYRFEFTPYGGVFIGDTLQASYLAGANLDVRLTPMLSIGADFGWSRITFDKNSNYGSTVTNRNLYAIQGLLTLNLPGAYLSRNKVVEVDFFTTIGGGVLRINNSMRGDGFIGGGMKLYTNIAPWFAFRVEARNYFSTLNSTDGSDFTTDWTVTTGPTFMIPPKLF